MFMANAILYRFTSALLALLDYIYFILTNGDWRKLQMTTLKNFFAAARSGDTEVLHQHILSGVDIHSCDDLALRIAAENGRYITVEFLINHGADIHALNDAALLWAAYYGETKTVKLLLKKGAGTEISKENAMIYAISKNRYDIVKIFLEDGVSPDFRNGAPLNCSKKYNYQNITKLIKSYMN